jgi:hypothetical protein
LLILLESVNSVKLSAVPPTTKYYAETGSRADGYYTFIPGFTAAEFASYLKKLNLCKAPSPFSTYFPRVYIPYVNDINYNEKEVIEAITRFREYGLIHPINEVFPGEMRFDISDDSLKSLVWEVWSVHNMDLDLLNGRLLYEGKPKDEDKEYLISLFGKRTVDRVTAVANLNRRSLKKESCSSKKIKHKVYEMQELESDRRALIDVILKRYEKVIQENEIARELIEGVCFSPFLSQKTRHH